MSTTTPAAVTLLQFYPVLAAVGGLLFWAGVLTQMLRDALRRISKLEGKESTDVAVAVEMGRIDQRLKGLESGQDHIGREMSGVQRSLANIASGRVGAIHKFEQDEHG